MARPSLSIHVYTDGGAKPNPGAGGWGAVFVRDRKVVRELCGGEPDTTNNRMELSGAIEALEALEEAHVVVIHTDSKYLQHGITRWIDGWRRNGWLTSAREPVQNRDLWERLDAAAARHEVRWEWVRGHAGNRYNERADRLAADGRHAATRGALSRKQTVADAVHIYAAASFSGKSGEGGFGVVLRYNDVRKVLAGREPGTSSNRMHLVGVIEGLRALKRRTTVHVYTASDYVRDGAERWVEGWRQRNWKTREGKAVEHRDLWETLDELRARHDVSWPALAGARPEDLEVAKEAARTGVAPAADSRPA